MMSQINMPIKNIIKIKLLFILSFLVTTLFPNNELENKKKSVESIETEIHQLEEDLKQQIEQQQKSEGKIDNLKLEIRKEKKEKIKKGQKKERAQSNLVRSNYILDSLKKELKNTQLDKTKTNLFIQTIKDSLNSINQIVEINQKELEKTKTKIQQAILEYVIIEQPTEIEFLIESNSWYDFIVKTTIYDMLLSEQKKNFNKLLNQQNKIDLKLIELNEQEINYNKNIEKLQSLVNLLNNKINIQSQDIQELQSTYNEIIEDYNVQEAIVINLSDSLEMITSDKQNLVKQKQKIEYEIKVRKESRDKIKKEIEKLIKIKKEFKGKSITKLKGQLPWPTDGSIITNFGKNINPETNIIINSDGIDIKPQLNKQEEIQYLAKQINPKAPNRNLVKRFQQLTMGLNQNDRGYGVFGPKTTAMWKKYNNLEQIISEQPIFAIHDGIIENVNFINPIIGVVVIIRHDNNYFSVYSGNIDIFVMEGSSVDIGDKIGSINKENILSFQLWNNNAPINPKQWISKK